ncbi:MAG: hypothetical protein JRF27_08630 [Deltaproteobacteria bacterium]|nr:hypothetical protein [Deltaproteobacteria bacterium]
MKRITVGDDIFETVLDAVPSPILIVDDNIRIHGYNLAAAPLFEKEPERALRMKCGDAFYCIHSEETPAGCGGGEACKKCVIRSAVSESYQGDKVVRKKTEMQLVTGNGEKPVQMLVTTAPLKYRDRSLVILTLEDVTELTALRGILPICAGCKKIRDDNEYWENVESYLEKRTEVQFTHGICPDCTKKLYPSIDMDA